MSKASSARLLKLALPLVKTHGFTRAALARSVLALPEGEAHTVPLSDTAISALFGNGDTARRTLIDAWMKEGLRHMSSVSASNVSDSTNSMKRASLRDVLRARLDYNEPVLAHLPEAFALLASPKYGIPPLDPTPALKHAASVADEACYVAGDQSLQLDWYAKRASLAVIYAASELHQLTSPHTAYAFLDSLFETSSNLKSSLGEIGLYSDYVFRSWKGIIKSSGVFL